MDNYATYPSARTSFFNKNLSVRFSRFGTPQLRFGLGRGGVFEMTRARYAAVSVRSFEVFRAVTGRSPDELFINRKHFALLLRNERRKAGGGDKER